MHPVGPGLLIVTALIAMVVVHEAGHFLAARRVGIRASKFYIFFPPAIFKRTRGDVEYGIGALPLGGFVKLPGMFKPSPRDVEWRLERRIEALLAEVDDAQRRTSMQAALGRVGESRDVERLPGALESLRAEVAAVDVPEAAGREAVVLTRTRAKLLTQIDNHLEDLHPQAYWRASLWRRMTVILAGPVVNLVMGLLLFLTLFTVAAPTGQEMGPVTVGTISKDSPIEDAGVREGDRVISWNGTRMTGLSVQKWQDLITDTRGNPVTAVVERGGDQRTVQLQPRTFKGSEGRKLVGVVFDPTITLTRGRQSLGKAAGDTWQQLRALTVGNLRGLARVVTAEGRKDLQSVVGIVDFADEISAQGLLLEYMAGISIVLAIFNLLPLLPLDGGHLFFGMLEFFRRGRALPQAAFERYSMLGLGLVLVLFFFGLRNDLGFS